jgi:hypothetical protein
MEFIKKITCEFLKTSIIRLKNITNPAKNLDNLV